ncbi:transcriptional regulator, partial [Salmonella enterica]|nr:transcriptional regulator [Salmonella enterica]
SDANLTQILYLLRRDLKGFGLSQFFSTVPRTGIKVDAEIIISNEKPKKTSSLRRAQYKYMVLFFASLSMITMIIFLMQ